EVMNRALLGLRQQHNAHIPIARLPNEILRKIFSFVSKVDPAMDLRGRGRSGDGDKETKSHAGWVAVTYVCQGWRDVAVNQPSLWADIPLALGPEWVKTFAARAQDVSLYLE
ncbi:hypothetical protein FA95DRAFT_1471617, partial [Auriscalpium vulgare]